MWLTGQAILGRIALYVGVVLVLLPIGLGTWLNSFLAKAERREGPPNRWMAALGAGASRDAFDYAFQRIAPTGAYVICELVGHTDEEPRVIGGIFGPRSAVGQTPSAHDLYLQALCTVGRDDHGQWTVTKRIDPDRGVYIPANEIARIELLPTSPPQLQGPSRAQSWKMWWASRPAERKPSRSGAGSDQPPA